MRALVVDRDGDTLVLSLYGEIDFLNAAAITESIELALRQACPARVRADLSGVTFLDSSGIGVLVCAMRAAKDASASFQVDHPSAGVLDQLDGAGLVEVFGLVGYEAEEPVERAPAAGDDR